MSGGGLHDFTTVAVCGDHAFQQLCDVVDLFRELQEALRKKDTRALAMTESDLVLNYKRARVQTSLEHVHCIRAREGRLAYDLEPECLQIANHDVANIWIGCISI